MRLTRSTALAAGRPVRGAEVAGATGPTLRGALGAGAVVEVAGPTKRRNDENVIFWKELWNLCYIYIIYVNVDSYYFNFKLGIYSTIPRTFSHNCMFVVSSTDQKERFRHSQCRVHGSAFGFPIDTNCPKKPGICFPSVTALINQVGLRWFELLPARQTTEGLCHLTVMSCNYQTSKHDAVAPAWCAADRTERPSISANRTSTATDTTQPWHLSAQRAWRTGIQAFFFGKCARPTNWAQATGPRPAKGTKFTLGTITLCHLSIGAHWRCQLPYVHTPLLLVPGQKHVVTVSQGQRRNASISA